MQETFVRAFLGLRRLRETGRFKPWILTIARNRARSLLAHRYLTRKVAVRWGSDPTTDRVRFLELDADGLASQQAVRDAIAELPEGAEKRTVELFYLDGTLTARQIAERLGVGKSAITMRLERFRARIKKSLMRRLVALSNRAP